MNLAAQTFPNPKSEIGNPKSQPGRASTKQRGKTAKYTKYAKSVKQVLSHISNISRFINVQQRSWEGRAPRVPLLKAVLLPDWFRTFKFWISDLFRISSFGFRIFGLLTLPTLTTLFTGCLVGPNFQPPQAPVPPSYSQTVSAPTNQPPETIAEWWRLFHDPQLDSLIQEAVLANLDMRLAQARVREARAQQGVARSILFPTVDANGQYRRGRVSQNSANGLLAQEASQPLQQDLFNAGFDMNWEIDIFGGNRRALEAAKADLGATEESSRGTRITVLADVGLNYLDLRGLQKQLLVARDNLHLQEQTLALTRERFRAGLANELDTSRAEAQAADTRSQIPLLEEDIQRSIHRLSILLGKEPAQLESQLATPAPIPPATPGIPVGLPSDLLRRRPDIRQAELEVAAATARIGVATADLFPKFSLTGTAGLESLSASDFFTGGSRYWSIGPTMKWPIFTAGRIRQNIKVQDARQEQTLIRYEQTVLNSLEEVENALVACGKEQEHHQSLAQSEAANLRAVELADQRYRSGLVDFLNVLETQRSLLVVQDGLARSERTMGQNIVRLYKALGGGWEGQTQLADLGARTPSKEIAKGDSL
jgi:NodT family efflux transporter outer membrane factor (OMF) lipoprotein